MNEIIAKVGRKNHLNHLINVMPLITFVFGVQCYLIHTFVQGVNIGDYALILGGMLTFFITSLMYYDNNHHVFIYKNHLKIFFPLLGTNVDLAYQDILEVIAPDQECNFSTMVIKTKDHKSYVFYFVDFPVSVKQLIEQQRKEVDITNTGSDNQDDMDQAA